MALHKILVGTDFSGASRAAAQRAAEVAARSGATLLLMHAAAYGEGSEAVAQLEVERAELARGGAAIEALCVPGPAAEMLLAAARAHDVELIVVGSHGRTGLARAVLGSVAEAVVRQSPVPVLVCRGEGHDGFARPLVATDFGAPAERALAAAVGLARPGAVLTVAHFAGRGQDPRSRAAHHLVARHARRGVKVEIVVEDSRPADGVLRQAAARGHDLIAVGNRGRGPLARAFAGSVSAEVVRRAECSVLVSR